MARLEKPGCTIDWQRIFSLPVGIPPESLDDGKRLAYIAALDVSGQILISTFDRFQTAPPAGRNARSAPAGAAAGSTLTILPRVTADTDASDLFDIPVGAIDGGANSVVTAEGAPFKASAPNPGTRPQIDDQLQAKLPRDKHANQFTPLPVPFVGLDTIRFYFKTKAAAGFPDALALDDPGVILPDDSIAAALPSTLIATQDHDADGNLQIGEVDRLLLRAPIAGRFRFEPYYHYQSAAAFKPLGPSNSGRLIFEQAAMSTREKRTDRTETLVYNHRYFALDHVDRASVAPLIYRHLVLHLRFLEAMKKQFDGATDEPRLTIEKSSPEVLSAVVSDVNHLLRGWTAFLKVLRWRPADVTVDGAIPAAWRTLFPAKEIGVGEIAKLVPIVNQILGQATWLSSLLFYCKNLHAPLLAGFTWTEALATLRAADPTVPEFPVTKDKLPFTPKTADNDKLVLQHERLRQIENPTCRWIACYAGAPVGKPAAVYAAAAGAANAFPTKGLTAYEVEALHAAGSAAALLGLGAAVAGAPGPLPGTAMPLAPYLPKLTGRACFFSASRIDANRLHTVADFLLELGRGIHFLPEAEDGFLDFDKLRDPDVDASTGSAHPILSVLYHDNHEKARGLRRQMDVVAATPLGDTSLTWWAGQTNLAPPPTAPSTPFRLARTLWRVSATMTFRGNVADGETIAFADFRGSGFPSGFGLFELECALLARRRMAKPFGVAPFLPVPVVLALMETEGLNFFAPITRHVRNTTAEGSTVSWVARTSGAWHDNITGYPDPDIPDRLGRTEFCGFPYGLDSMGLWANDGDFNTKQHLDRESAAGFDSNRTSVIDLTDNDVLDVAADDPRAPERLENLAQYLRDRVWSFKQDRPVDGLHFFIPHIWKRHRRVHWAYVAMMVGFFRYTENRMKAPSRANRFADAAWTPDAGWDLAAAPPDVTGKSPTSTEWKDYITHYVLRYHAYNAGPDSWRATLRNTEGHPAFAASGLSLRDFLLFKRPKAAGALSAMDNMVRFAIALDAYMRLDALAGKVPSAYAAAVPDQTAIAARSGPGGTWGI